MRNNATTLVFKKPETQICVPKFKNVKTIEIEGKEGNEVNKQLFWYRPILFPY